jgi:hypothetical protein
MFETNMKPLEKIMTNFSSIQKTQQIYNIERAAVEDEMQKKSTFWENLLRAKRRINSNL